jgi:hypothetical protein
MDVFILWHSSADTASQLLEMWSTKELDTMMDISEAEENNLVKIADILEKSVTYGARTQKIALRFKGFADEWDEYFSKPVDVREFMTKIRYFMLIFSEIIGDWGECATDLLDACNDLGELFDNILQDKYNEPPV